MRTLCSVWLSHSGSSLQRRASDEGGIATATVRPPRLDAAAHSLRHSSNKVKRAVVSRPMATSAGASPATAHRAVRRRCMHLGDLLHAHIIITCPEASPTTFNSSKQCLQFGHGCRVLRGGAVTASARMITVVLMNIVGELGVWRRAAAAHGIAAVGVKSGASQLRGLATA